MHVDAREGGILLARQGLNAANDLPRPRAFGGDLLQPFPHFIQPGGLAVEPAQARSGVRDDRHQRLVDLMGDGGGQLPDGGGPGHPRQIRLRHPHGILRGALAGDIGDDAVILVHLAAHPHRIANPEDVAG